MSQKVLRISIWGKNQVNQWIILYKIGQGYFFDPWPPPSSPLISLQPQGNDLLYFSREYHKEWAYKIWALYLQNWQSYFDLKLKKSLFEKNVVDVAAGPCIWV